MGVQDNSTNTGLSNSSRLFRTLIKQAFTHVSAQVGIYQQDCRLVWANDHFTKTFINRLNNAPRSCLNHLHAENEHCPDYVIRKTAETGIIQHSMFKVTDTTGTVWYYNSHTFPMYDRTNALTHIVEISWDISQDVARDAILCEHSALLSNLADMSLDAILVINKDGLITFWNKGAGKMLGYGFDEALHKPFRMIFPKTEEAERDINLMKQLLHVQDYLKNFETVLQKKDGQSVQVEITRAVMDTERRDDMGSYWIIRDISARKNIEYLFRQTIEELAKLHEISQLLHRSTSEEEIYEIMLVSVTAGEGLKFNRAFLLMVKYETQQLEGKLAIGPANPEEAGIIWSQIPRQFTTLEEILKSYKSRDRRKREKVMDIVGALTIPLDEADNIMIQAINNNRSYVVNNGAGDTDFDPQICYIINNDSFAVIPIIIKEIPVGVIIVDNVFNREPITERDVDSLEIFAAQAGLALENARLQAHLQMHLKELEQAYSTLQDSQQKLIRSERLATVGEVVAKISHEIRNPLVSIGGFANRLLNDFGGGHQDAYQYLKIIADETKRLEDILDKILNYSALLAPKKELVNLKDLINKNLLIVINDLHNQNVSLQLEIDSADSIMHIDPNQMTQVFINIIRNCLQAMPKGGRLKIHSERGTDCIKVEFIDTGIGIKKKDLERLFQPFFTTKSLGLGLGLSISQQIMQNHGGKIEVKSQYRKGSTFSIYLPIT